MEEYDVRIKQIMAALQKQKAQVGEAKVFKGQKPSASMKRSRQQLEYEFAMVVGFFQAKPSYGISIT